MSIILRTNKGSALTYDEMDRNLSQFFYSSSISPDGTKLRLHFTGSNNLDSATEDFGPTRYQEIPLVTGGTTTPTPGTATAAGDNTQIQFNEEGAFGADSVFVFNKNNNLLGVGTSNPQDRLDIQGDGIKGGSISLRGFSSGTGETKHAKINFYEGSTLLGKLGRVNSDDSNIYLTNNYSTGGTGFGKVNISIGSNGNESTTVAATFTRNDSKPRLGVGTQVPNRVGTFVGETGIGISLNSANTNQSYLSPIPSSIYDATTGGLKKLIPNNSDAAGLLISSPNTADGGNIVVALNTDSTQKEGFNIISSTNNTDGSFANTSLIASFQASGKVGINTNFPSDVGLTVAGNISGSGTLQIETVADDATNYSDLSPIGVTSTGLVKKINNIAAPVPVGGIIMWSGTTSNIPTGWVLCDGVNGTPDLRDRFVVGAGSTYSPNNTGGSADAVIVSHTHTGTTTSNVTNICGRVATTLGTSTGCTTSFEEGKGTPDWSTTTTNSTTHSHTLNIDTIGESGTNKNLPPYYALAFIMYVGT